MAPATFYTVKGPRGIYYAVRNHHTGKVWTERTELAAQRQADDEQLAIVASETIGHSQLLDLMIVQGLNTQASDAPAPSTASPRPPAPGGSGLSRIFKLFHRDNKHTSHHGDSSQ